MKIENNTSNQNEKIATESMMTEPYTGNTQYRWISVDILINGQIDKNDVEAILSVFIIFQSQRSIRPSYCWLSCSAIALF